MIMYPQIAQMNADSLVPMQSVVGRVGQGPPSEASHFVYFVYFVAEPEKGRCALIAEDSTHFFRHAALTYIDCSPWRGC